MRHTQVHLAHKVWDYAMESGPFVAKALFTSAKSTEVLYREILLTIKATFKTPQKVYGLYCTLTM